MDRFLFQYPDYAVLGPVKDESFDNVPIPFQSCLFIFQDAQLRVKSELSSNCVLVLTFYRLDKQIPIGEARVALVDYRWSVDSPITCTGSVPPDCLYEFIQFYQRLSIYLYQDRPVVNISPREIIQAERLEYKVSPNKRKDPGLDERIISLRDLSVKFVYHHIEQFLDHSIEDPSQPRHQLNPCDYAYWVRGHTRIYKTGKKAWVRPHMRNTKYPERARTYKL